MQACKPTHKLGESVTAEQHQQLESDGYLVFRGLLSPDEVATMCAEIERVADAWTLSGRQKVKGVPLFYGHDHQDQPFLQRLAFVSCYSDIIRDIITDGRFQPILDLVGKQARIGQDEKDGVVVNRNMNVPGSVYPRLGWHTDGLRDVFYLRKPKRMLNVGLHFDRVTADDGGLRLIPGSHHQDLLSTATHKLYFLDHRPDEREVVVETEPGDLTLHDGRLWHRVAQSSRTGASSLRRTMYMPFINDAPNPRSEASRTPPYHYAGLAIRRGRTAWYRFQKRFGLA